MIDSFDSRISEEREEEECFSDNIYVDREVALKYLTDVEITFSPENKCGLIYADCFMVMTIVHTLDRISECYPEDSDIQENVGLCRSGFNRFREFQPTQEELAERYCSKVRKCN
jgi:hypothetical protein